MSGVCEAGWPLPDFGPCKKCGASDNDLCLLVHEGEPTAGSLNPDSLEDLYEALADAELVLEWGEPKPKPVLARAQRALAKDRGES